MYQRIRDLREDHDWTQQRLADMLHMSQKGYSQYELGKSNIPCEILIQLSKLYATSVDYLLGLTDDPPPK